MFFLRNIFKPKTRKIERRKSERVSAEGEVKIDFQTMTSRRISGIGTGNDISISGMRFATFAPLKKGQMLEAALYFGKKFPGLKKIPLQMTVVRVYKPFGSRRYRIGVSFIESPRYKQEFEVLKQLVFWLRTQTG